ncbi:hypothetical protein [Mucilaginibacter phyllosphaerae]
MSFERFRAQLVCEDLMGCTSFDDFFNSDFDAFSLTKASSFVYNAALKDDANDLYFKGILSLTEGINGYYHKQYSWAIIKCYYSIFYFLRSELALKDIGLIRHRVIYYLEAQDGAMPITKGKKGSKRNLYSGDHKATINYYKDLFSSDILLSQEIEDLNAYEWLMKKREQINYQERTFNEPNYPQFLLFIDQEITKGNFDELIKEIIDDEYVKTFQPEYASIAIPIKRALLTYESFVNNGYNLTIQKSKLDFLKSITKTPIINF